MADQNVKIILSAKDETKGAIKSAEGGIAGLAGAAKKFAAIAGVAFATKQIFDFGRACVEEFSKSEVSIAKVNALLETLPESVNISTDEVLKLADAATKLGFSDEAAAESIAFFTQRTNDLAEATKLNNLAMDLARAKNIDLSTAANLVGQVMSGNGRALKQFGIEIDETLGPMAALGELQEKVAGQSAAFVGTTAGQMAILSESWGNFQEQIGATLAEALVPFLQQMIVLVTDPRFIAFFNSLAKVAVGGVILAVKTMVGAFEELVHIWESLFALIDKLKAGFDKLAAAARAVVDAVSGAVGGAVKKISGRQRGGPVRSSSTFLVGEAGPELFRPKSAGDIIPNGALSGGGGIVINITGNFLIDDFAGERIAQQIMKAIKSNLRI